MVRRVSWFGLVSLLLVLLLSACAASQPAPDTSAPAAGVVKIYKSPT